MTPARHCITVTLACLILTSTAQSEQDPSATVRAATRLASLFSELLKPFKEIGDTAEKQRLIDGLLSLNHDLFQLEQEKRYVVIALGRRPLNKAELMSASDSLSQKISKLRQSLTNLAPQLRVAYRKSADEAIDLLTEALVTRKGFVLDLGSANDASAESNIKDAKAAVSALSKAQVSLADAIAALQKQKP